MTDLTPPTPAPAPAGATADPDDATRAQRRAADPARSTWLTANAGSGKTRVLTDRVARLLLRGTRPERILCLTYTKAAASEMQNRLLSRLGSWAMLPDGQLTGELQRLAPGDTPDLRAARRLFAQAIETPGGLKVQTIHSFCAAVLRRFPLEAGVPHGFAELDDRSAANLRAEIVEQMARQGDPTLTDIAMLLTDDRLDRFLASLRDFDSAPCRATIWDQVDLPDGFTPDSLLAHVFPDGDCSVIAELLPHLRTSGSRDRTAGDRLAAGRWDQPGINELILLEHCLLTGAKATAPFTAKIGGFPAKALQTGACAALMEALTALMERVEIARPRRLALDHARRTLALQAFGCEFCRRYAEAKQAGGWLDFDDLITRTARLLSDSTMAPWVLFRLDGGIDHILVDEAQDTSPGQWRVIQRLTDEFTAGAGARAAAPPGDARPDGSTRTLFVVGDPKQSIYSFQGADIAVFEERQRDFQTAFSVLDPPMQQAALEHSFRSSPAILSLVDAVFAGDAARGLGAPPHHIAFRADLPGRVDLWTPVPEPEGPPPRDWHRPVDAPAPNAATTVLAQAVASRIESMLGQPITSVRDNRTRPIRPGDILVLVQRRSRLFPELIRALKARGLPVAGADRLKLAAEIAVRDIRAVLSFLATPEDDLALATALRSPLFGLSEDDLYRLAAPRRGYLWQALRDSAPDSAGRVAYDLLADLQGQADFLRPHDLIARLLIRHGGRARLIGRLGHEAEDGIDELMSQALTYERAEVPSLTGFLVWLAEDETEVRRQPGAAGEGAGLIRVMTVHGAKGLESPIVILPDTAERRANDQAQILTPPTGPPAIWRGRSDERPEPVSRWVKDEVRRRDEENRRLLYVALTRAESWLIVAAAGKTGPDCWHGLVSSGMDRLTGAVDPAAGAAPALTESHHEIPGIGRVRRLTFGDWPQLPGDAPPAPPTTPAPLPLWAAALPATPPRPPRQLAATGLGGAKALGSMADADRQAAMLTGTRLHLLLEELPGRDPADWPAIARATLAGAEGGLPDAATLDTLLDEVAAVIGAADLAALFTPDDPGATVLQEVPLTATLPGIGPLTGTIDRLIVAPDRVHLIDYKSNADLPGTAAEVPEGILRQMAAYRAALALIYPGRALRASVLWTRGRRLMDLPDPLLDAALDRARAALDGTGPAAHPTGR
ncbi:double-strand break repair helicase AddA [uncultured Paracoccus sp.]|uniref:double-strand break repair helicase AddA n=1 Tax=uncultured Paracoccus sp. TaxID=189685 RepID=UPI00260B79E7|nr:double-strand break repair helicase AddA [uncultured Paracoccus sp.]